MNPGILTRIGHTNEHFVNRMGIDSMTRDVNQYRTEIPDLKVIQIGNVQVFCQQKCKSNMPIYVLKFGQCLASVET